MNPEIAAIAIQFLKRVQLAGAEVEAYTAVITALQKIAGPQQAVEVEAEA